MKLPSREAPPCLPRPNGVGGELHSISFFNFLIRTDRLQHYSEVQEGSFSKTQLVECQNHVVLFGVSSVQTLYVHGLDIVF